jgi:hypothetical protein
VLNVLEAQSAGREFTEGCPRVFQTVNAVLAVHLLPGDGSFEKVFYRVAFNGVA